jgi:3-hydroxyacyl-CoA dehydrogenase/enoyl-CoA hydratase/3-hydroxybutyryl-CoA epimerase
MSRDQEDPDRRQRHPRLLRQPLRAALHERELQHAGEGVPPAMIENAAKMAGMPVGPLALNDEVAIDLSLKIVKRHHRRPGRKGRRSAPSGARRNHGREGRPAGPQERQGLLRLSGETRQEASVAGTEDALPAAGPAKVDVRNCKNRYLAGQSRSKPPAVEEGIVTDPREADLGTILGFGFAPYTGGALSYIDTMGAKAFVDMCKVLARKYGKQFKAPKLLVEMAEKGETFYGRFNPYREDKAAA